MVERIFKVVLLDAITELEYEQLLTTGGEFGITDVAISESARIILAEVEEEETVEAIIRWLSHSLFTVEDIGVIEESVSYHPRFETEEHGPFDRIIVKFDD